MKILNWIISYLKDWKNILTHSIIGVSILVIAFYLPVKPAYRTLALILVITFNVLRMRLAKVKSEKK